MTVSSSSPGILQHQTVGKGFEREGLAMPVLIARAHQYSTRASA